MKKMRTLVIDELYFSASHWIPNHPKCGVLHGHTYFVKDLQVIVEGFVDLGDIKKAVMQFDHLTLVPQCNTEAWHCLCDFIANNKLCESLRKVFSRYRVIIDTDLPGTTVERIGEELQKDIEEIPGVVSANFELYEGPNAGCEI